jgi:hypothetical protein
MLDPSLSQRRACLGFPPRPACVRAYVRLVARMPPSWAAGLADVVPGCASVWLAQHANASDEGDAADARQRTPVLPLLHGGDKDRWDDFVMFALRKEARNLWRLGVPNKTPSQPLVGQGAWTICSRIERGFVPARSSVPRLPRFHLERERELLRPGISPFLVTTWPKRTALSPCVFLSLPSRLPPFLIAQDACPLIMPEKADCRRRRGVEATTLVAEDGP